MTEQEARIIERKFYDKSTPSKEDITTYIAAMEYLIETLNLPEDMMSLGGYYYEARQFELALKYYEQAATFGIDAADECLGYIWYYGRTGTKDYRKAFEHYSRSMKRGNITCAYKVADMYKNGYYVEKNYDKYVEIIEGLYHKTNEMKNLFDPFPEIMTRMAGIRKGQGEYEEAVRMYFYAKDFLAQRICYNAFFGNLSIMKRLIEDLYDIIEFDEMSFDLYDLYYVLKEPATVSFKEDDYTYVVESFNDNGCMKIRFGEIVFKDIDEFFAKACDVDEEKLTAISRLLEEFEIVE